MTGDTIDCYNCGRPNPSWAQVCRSCGVPMRTGRNAAERSGPIPTDSDSLISIGASLVAIVGAIVLGLLLSGMLPDAPVVAESTPSPTPSASAEPIASEELPTEEPSVEPTPEPTPELIGTVTFGTGINASTREVTNATDTFGPGVAFCHSVQLTEAFGVDAVQEEVLRVEDDGSLTVVQDRQGSNLKVSAGAQIAGFCAPATGPLIAGWGTGEFVLRDYRNPTTPELIAEGRFTLTN